MSAFKQLKDVSNKFEQQLRAESADLFSAKIVESFEDDITKKLQNLSLFNSKLRLLRAKTLAATPQVVNQLNYEDTIKEFEDTAVCKVQEQSIVKSLTQAQAVRGLLTAPNQNLDPEFMERKEKIIQELKEYSHLEFQLRQLDSLYRERQEELASTRTEWDKQLTDLRGMKENATEESSVNDLGPLYKDLRKVLDKLELMRWFLGRLVTSRGRCDWLADTKRTVRILKLARTPNTVETFIEM